MIATSDLLHPSEAITREQALIAYTTGSAYAERQEDMKGKIKPGLVADWAVLSQDILDGPSRFTAGNYEFANSRRRRSRLLGRSVAEPAHSVVALEASSCLP